MTQNQSYQPTRLLPDNHRGRRLRAKRLIAQKAMCPKHNVLLTLEGPQALCPICSYKQRKLRK